MRVGDVVIFKTSGMPTIGQVVGFTPKRVRLAQMMIIPCFTPEFVVVDQFSEQTERGAGGFNSTGTA